MAAIAALGRKCRPVWRQVAERTAMDKVQAGSRAVQSLLAAGRIARSVDSEDARVTQLSLSAKGLVIYNEVVPLALQLEKKSVGFKRR